MQLCGLLTPLFWFYAQVYEILSVYIWGIQNSENIKDFNLTYKGGGDFTFFETLETESSLDKIYLDVPRNIICKNLVLRGTLSILRPWS